MTAALAVMVLTSGLVAQQPPGVMAPVASERMIDVAVTYSFMVPIKGEDLLAQSKSLEAARRMIYEIAANECATMRATIAATCRLERFNVQSNMQRHGPGQEMAQVSANASYKVGLKSGQ